MSKKLQANGLWESSRMMLPQHKERIIEHRSRDNDQIKPLLHEDEWEAIYQNIGISYRYTEEANFEVFELNSKRFVSGIVSKVNELGKKIRVEWEDGNEWIDIKSLVAVRLSGGGLE
ncbi:YolD-like family protein [Paenibacillus sp. CFBP 13594]|uniref:YolD-like family protein n=1 Tax=Paenibacillus sp. CFBP 13594 TaxID=2774037 RepID=UPI001782029E|nr:YolD-like family protein [Paenibacillus sp. CFBP 13594]MBD8839912.1 YolD-like family protein [Paenibacillus sp. CFBP 13594]